MSSNVRLVSLDGTFKFIDNDKGILKTRKINRLIQVNPASCFKKLVFNRVGLFSGLRFPLIFKPLLV